MKKIFLVLFVIAIAMTQCNTPKPTTTTSASDTLNSNVNQKSPDTSMMSKDTSMRRDSIRLHQRLAAYKKKYLVTLFLLMQLYSNFFWEQACLLFPIPSFLILPLPKTMIFFSMVQEEYIEGYYRCRTKRRYPELQCTI